METIVVTTDFSTNSRAGIRYAIQLGRLRNAKILFVHVHQVLPASSWSEQQYQRYIERNREVLMKEGSSFIKSIYHSLALTPSDPLSLVIHHNFDTTEGIMEYARKVNASYICISTRGAGGMRKLFGTNASKLIRMSSIPVLCIPSSYRLKPIKHVLYASDMSNYENELKEIVVFARPLKASVEMLHLSYLYELLFDEDQFKKHLIEKAGYKIDLHWEARDVQQSILDEIQAAVRRSRPSVLAVFTHQDRSLFDRLLLPGNAKEYSFHGTVPLLSIPKAKISQLDRTALNLRDHSASKRFKTHTNENK